MSKMNDLEDLIEVAVNGDKYGLKPDLTQVELDTLIWAKQRIDQLESILISKSNEVISKAYREKSTETYREIVNLLNYANEQINKKDK